MINHSLKIISSLVYSLFIIYTPFTIINLLPILYIVILSYKDILYIIKKIFVLNFFVVFLVAFVYLQNQNEAITLFYKINAILLFNITLFNKIDGIDLVRALKSLKVPHKLTTIFYFSIVLIKYLQNEIKEVKNTLKLRGFIPKTNLFTYKTYGYVFGLLFIKVLRKADEINLSMETRNCKTEIYLFEATILNKRDFVLIGVILFVILMRII